MTSLRRIAAALERLANTHERELELTAAQWQTQLQQNERQHREQLAAYAASEDTIDLGPDQWAD
jgi:hypothetical protein